MISCEFVKLVFFSKFGQSLWQYGIQFTFTTHWSTNNHNSMLDFDHFIKFYHFCDKPWGGLKIVFLTSLLKSLFQYRPRMKRSYIFTTTYIILVYCKVFKDDVSSNTLSLCLEGGRLFDIWNLMGIPWLWLHMLVYFKVSNYIPSKSLCNVGWCYGTNQIGLDHSPI